MDLFIFKYMFSVELILHNLGLCGIYRILLANIVAR